ncbi:hypothetical protein [Marinimicrobium sp. ABcell2]|uniref:hypothetical protein n=1 Tax=Marinimicrobium sp. ABcell2 TaxID=3069751 RepID=UPI0027B48AA4|nr:hypothetical protein [Marinimicrobium sp. ABcell2]MDQ2077441.1 hypothetical protein [Marinimicrobium sp. ABcell2]
MNKLVKRIFAPLQRVTPDYNSDRPHSVVFELTSENINTLRTLAAAVVELSANEITQFFSAKLWSGAIVDGDSLEDLGMSGEELEQLFAENPWRMVVTEVVVSANAFSLTGVPKNCGDESKVFTPQIPFVDLGGDEVNIVVSDR